MAKKAKKSLNFPQITQKFLEIAQCGFADSLSDNNGRVCIEAAICIALGDVNIENEEAPENRPGDRYELSDEPTCVDGDLRSLKISINDALEWNSPMERAKTMARLGILQLGTKGMPSVMKGIDEFLTEHLCEHNKELAVAKKEAYAAFELAVNDRDFEFIYDTMDHLKEIYDALDVYTLDIENYISNGGSLPALVYALEDFLVMKKTPGAVWLAKNPQWAEKLRKFQGKYANPTTKKKK